jgi:hypothetical protein
MRSNFLHRRRGLSSLLAMLYLILFATLALGFYASTTTQTQVVANDSNGSRASLAAETGIDFVRFHLAQVSIPALTTEANLMQEVYNDLAPMLDGTDNLDGNTISINSARNEIQIPGGADNFISLQNGAGPRFRAIITQDGRNLVVSAIGNSGASAARAGTAAGMRLTFKTEQFPGTFFKNGMASKGTVLLDGVRVIQGIPASMASVMSTLDAANAITIGSGNTSNPGGIAGTITAIDGRTPIIRTGASVAGTANVTTIQDEHVTYMKPTEVPDFPVADTSIFKPFATNVYIPAQPTYDNIIIPPGVNPIFASGTVVRGVVYVQQPNLVTFNGNVSITGVIATEPTGTGIAGVTNTITFSGNGGTKQGVQALPDEPQFIGLKKLGGPFIVAPAFHVQMTGNFGSVAGHIAADSVTVSGSSAATLTGSVVALKETKQLRVGGAATITFAEDASLGYAGLRFRERLYADPSTYQDFRP